MSKEEFVDYNEEVTRFLKEQQNDYLNEFLRSSLKVVKDFLKEKEIEADVEVILGKYWEDSETKWVKILINTDIEEYEERRRIWKAIERRLQKIHEEQLKAVSNEEEIEELKVANCLLTTMVRGEE